MSCAWPGKHEVRWVNLSVLGNGMRDRYGDSSQWEPIDCAQYNRCSVQAREVGATAIGSGVVGLVGGTERYQRQALAGGTITLISGTLIRAEVDIARDAWLDAEVTTVAAGCWLRLDVYLWNDPAGG